LRRKPTAKGKKMRLGSRDWELGIGDWGVTIGGEADDWDEEERKEGQPVGVGKPGQVGLDVADGEGGQMAQAIGSQPQRTVRVLDNFLADVRDEFGQGVE
jgi:hypothetical protein